MYMAPYSICMSNHVYRTAVIVSHNDRAWMCRTGNTVEPTDLVVCFLYPIADLLEAI